MSAAPDVDARPAAVAAEAKPRRRRRHLLRAVVALVLVVTLGWLAAAWYFTDVLYDDALRVNPPPAGPTFDVEVLAVTSDTVTLATGPDASAEVSAPGTWGLRWEGGDGTLTDVRTDDGERVTRTFTLLDGAPPEAGDLADVDKYLFGDTPDEILGLDWQPVDIPTPLGTQDAWFVPADGALASAPDGDATVADYGGPWAILVHGKGADRDEMLRTLRTVHSQGLPALVITYSGDRGQPIDPSGRYGYGATEWADLDAAVAYALDRGATDLVLVGSSTGAALIGAWFDHGANTDAAVAVVLDSQNADVERTFAYGASQRTIPGTSVPLPPALTWTAFRISELRFGLDLDAADTSDTLARIDVPVLAFHGTGDRTVPVGATRDLVAARDVAGLPTTYVETDAGEHVGSYNHDPERYEEALGAFLSDAVAQAEGS